MCNNSEYSKWQQQPMWTNVNQSERKSKVGDVEWQDTTDF